MSGFFAFFKKECVSQKRTYKWLVLGLVFLLFGILNPLAAKFLPDILGSILPGSLASAIPESVALDSWQQFFKNSTQMGLLLLAILFSGQMSREYTQGTLLPLLTRGLSRTSVVFAKFAAAAASWTVAYFLSFGVTYLYTLYFWPDTTFTWQLFLSVCGVWEFGLFILALALLGGIAFRNSYGALLLTGGIIIVLFLLAAIPAINEWNPVVLVSQNLGLIQNSVACGTFLAAGGITAALTLLALMGACILFKRQQL